MPFHEFAGADVCLQLTPPSPDVKIKPRDGCAFEFVDTARARPSPEEASELQSPAGNDTEALVQL